ncbi:chloride channel protein [Puteibacter caeruleilacunae]|nr:chloride channel protein [Puteibacter caeruleilacunae]
MSNKQVSLFVRFHKWRLKNFSEKGFVMILSAVIGIVAGFAAVIIKNSVHFIQYLVHRLVDDELQNYIYFILPVIGILLAVLVIKYVIKLPVRHGIPNVLHSISKRRGQLSKHNMFSSIVTSAFTVGCGGSVGLEGPTVATGAAYGAFISRFLRLDYKYVTLMLACACAGAMAAIFKAPIAAIVFAVEVIMIDLTTLSLVPLLLASASAVLTSYFFLGQDVLYPFQVVDTFELDDLPFYIALGIVAGLISAYFAKIYHFIHDKFEKISSGRMRLLIGGLSLGILLFFFPALYGEGYESINACLAGDFNYLHDHTFFGAFTTSQWVIIGLMLAVILLKVVAASLTFGAGGVGGIFAPTLFMGVNTGMVFALVVNQLGIRNLNENNFALIGMAGLIAGVLHAPLTGIFLIADISGGYQMFVPLMVTATFSYMTVKVFIPESVYHFQLSKRKELFTHHKDISTLRMMEAKRLIETDFVTLSPDANLGDLTKAISEAHRNLFPVVDENGKLHGMIKMVDVRKLIFKPELYDKIMVKDLMYMPEYFISPEDSMEVVAEKFESSGRFNLAVIHDGKYLGFISRAKVFTSYRRIVRHFSHD